ncbi:MAG: DUF3390 domain-containing protein, partial [Actinomycetota bacterium]|nr:DUF3390 domain-containing protein [Actinomycetota bacterium]
ADNASLPYASSLCGACYEVCPVKIDIPSMLVHLRARAAEEESARRRLPGPEEAAMAAAAWVMSSPARFAAAQRGGRLGRLFERNGRLRRLPPPLAPWTGARDAPTPPPETFREWWARERGGRR